MIPGPAMWFDESGEYEGHQVIPEAAVDAARDVLYENDRSIDIDYATLEAALEAAAPHMLAELADSREGDLFRFTWAQREWLRGGAR